MAYKILNKCPVCSGKLKAVKLKCQNCGTIIENDFEFSKFDYLDDEHLSFIEIFLKCRGNIKDVEKEMGISYPTVRTKLNEVVTALGYTLVKKPAVDSKDVVDMLERGEITADQAVNMLKENI